MSLHVLPADDHLEHQLRPDCPCEPAAEVRRRVGGTTGLVVVHLGWIDRGRRDARQMLVRCRLASHAG